MKSNLEGVPDSLGNMRNQIGMTFFRAYASPEAEYNQGGWHIRFQMPITFTPYYYNDKLMGAKENISKTQVVPQLSVSYFLTARLQATLSGGIAQREVDEQNFYQGLLMRDYRNLYTGLWERKRISARHRLFLNSA